MLWLLKKYAVVAAIFPAYGHCFLVSNRAGEYSQRQITSHGAKKDSEGGKGFGNGDNRKRRSDVVEKTYSEATMTPIRDLIDDEGAMSEFFSANDAWAPLFRSLAPSSSVPAMSFLGGENGRTFDYDNDSGVPCRQLDGKPQGDEDMTVVASFLDSCQQSLLDIPVSEVIKDDEDDLHFIEEGRRLLVVSRFHVLSGVTEGNIEHHENIFAACWSEIAELRRADEADTGSLIMLPNYSISDLRRFVDMNLQRPLAWLGISELFEVTSLQRGIPAIRLIHRLSGIPEVTR